MSSKQEKLAAARRKLKEFQGKSKEQKTDENVAAMPSKEPSLSSTDSSPCFVQPFKDHTNLENAEKTILNVTNCQNEGKPFDSHLTKTNSPLSWSEGNQQFNNNNNLNKISGSENLDYLSIHEVKNAEETITGSKTASGLNPVPPDLNKSVNLESVEPLDLKNKYVSADFIHSSNMFPDKINSSFFQPVLEKNNTSHENVSVVKDSFTDSHFVTQKDFLNKDSKLGAFYEVVKPLQEELENHVQTINLLIQQRNDAQNSLSQTQNFLTEKSAEVEKLNNHITCLTSSVNDLHQKILQEEELIKILKIEREENLEKNKEAQSHILQLQKEVDSREEKCQETRRKYEEKCKECQQLSITLQKTQSQLSLSQIQIQQFSSGEHSSLSAQVAVLQTENSNLKQQIENLEKKIEADYTETEQSSQNFFVYAQQCNSQLASLNSQVKTLMSEKEKLADENANLKKKLTDMENLKEQEFSSKAYETQLKELQNQISVVMDEKTTLWNNLKTKEEECAAWHKDAESKELTIKDLKELLKQAEAENEKLIAEAENPKANGKLLAVMESDKVAAAKAVSQNQKLKQQVVELEEAFMKLSQEKLELTDQLAHEKHTNSELQKLLKNSETSEHKESHDHDCHHRTKEEPLINDSNEIEELRNIIRQLQDDKVELKARLNSYESTKPSSVKENPGKTWDVDVEESKTECENTKLLLQRMEEKVKRTMNEIAVLDEEKEKLEHLVLQLQGETETIGEYITLYQTQRRMLRQRAQEKDNQLLQLSKDKEELKSKLSALDELVHHLIGEKQNASQSDSSTASLDVSNKTAGKIRALISEIGSTTWINNHSVAFEHCSCCSGRLITI